MKNLFNEKIKEKIINMNNYLYKAFEAIMGYSNEAKIETERKLKEFEKNVNENTRNALNTILDTIKEELKNEIKIIKREKEEIEKLKIEKEKLENKLGILKDEKKELENQNKFNEKELESIREEKEEIEKENEVNKEKLEKLKIEKDDLENEINKIRNYINEYKELMLSVKKCSAFEKISKKFEDENKNIELIKFIGVFGNGEDFLRDIYNEWKEDKKADRTPLNNDEITFIGLINKYFKEKLNGNEDVFILKEGKFDKTIMVDIEKESEKNFSTIECIYVPKLNTERYKKYSLVKGKW